jgi:hypothetical protein
VCIPNGARQCSFNPNPAELTTEDTEDDVFMIRCV